MIITHLFDNRDQQQTSSSHSLVHMTVCFEMVVMISDLRLSTLKCSTCSSYLVFVYCRTLPFKFEMTSKEINPSSRRTCNMWRQTSNIAFVKHSKFNMWNRSWPDFMSVRASGAAVVGGSFLLSYIKIFDDILFSILDWSCFFDCSRCSMDLALFWCWCWCRDVVKSDAIV
jgi:hypothetical protein